MGRDVDDGGRPWLMRGSAGIAVAAEAVIGSDPDTGSGCCPGASVTATRRTARTRIEDIAALFAIGERRVLVPRPHRATSCASQSLVEAETVMAKWGVLLQQQFVPSVCTGLPPPCSESSSCRSTRNRALTRALLFARDQDPYPRGILARKLFFSLIFFSVAFGVRALPRGANPPVDFSTLAEHTMVNRLFATTSNTTARNFNCCAKKKKKLLVNLPTDAVARLKGTPKRICQTPAQPIIGGKV